MTILQVLRIKYQVKSDNLQYDAGSQTFSNMIIKPAEEKSLPFTVTLNSKSYPRGGSVTAYLELKDEDGKHYDNVVLDKKCRFPYNENSSFLLNFMVVLGVILFLLSGAVASLIGIYGTKNVAKFIESRGNFKALTKKGGRSA